MRNAHRWCAVIGKPGCARLEGTPAMDLKETLAKFQAERGNETSDDNGSDDMTSKAERKQKSDASPVEFSKLPQKLGVR